MGNRIIISKLYFLISLFFLPLPLFSGSETIGTYGGAFMKIPSGSAKFQALGSNGVSYLEGSDAMSVNPAGIAASQMKEVNFSYISWFSDYSGKYISYVQPIDQYVLGFNLGYFSIDGFDARDESGIPLNSEDIKVKDYYGSITLAKSFMLEKLLLGASLKTVNEDNYLEKQNNLVYDAGFLVKISRKLSLGYSGQNMGAKNKEVASVQRYGFTWKFNPFLLVTVDQKKFSDDNSKTGFGVEFNVPEELLQLGKIVIRTGYTDTVSYGRNYEDKTMKNLGLDKISGWSFGIGIYSAQSLGNVFGLDFAMTPFGALGKTSQFTLKYQF